MGDIRLPQFIGEYDQNKMGEMVDTLENKLANISSVIASANRADYQLAADVAPVGNVGSGESDLMSYSMQPNVMARTGYNIEIKAWGLFAANINNKEVKLYFGDSVLLDSGSVIFSGISWYINATVVRVDSSTQQSIATIATTNALIASSSTYVEPSESLSGIIEIKCTGSAIASDDIIQKGLLIKVSPQL